MADLKDTTVNGTGYIKLPTGTTAQRPATTEGYTRYNTSNNNLEVYNGKKTDWSSSDGQNVLEYITSSWKWMGQEGDQTTYTGVVPSTAQEGDLAVAFFASDTPVNQTTPSGWTLLGSGDDGEFPKSYLYAKVLTSGDPGSTVSVSTNGNVDYCMAINIFRPRYTINSFTAKNFTNVKGPSSYSTTISNSGVSGPCLAISSLTGRTGPQQPTLTMGISDAIVANPSNNIPKIGYTVFENGDTPPSIGISVNDTGRQSLSGVFIEIR